MAYAAVLSLKQTIKRLLEASEVPIVSSGREMIEFAYKDVESLQELLGRLVSSRSSGSKMLNALDGQIREAVHKLEDVLEFHESDHFLPKSESHDIEDVRQELNSFTEMVKLMKEEYNKELETPQEEDDDDDANDDHDDSDVEDAAVSSCTNDFDGEMVGLSADFTKIKENVIKGTRPSDFGVFSIVSKPGTGRTIVASKIFYDFYIKKKEFFDCGGWYTIGRGDELKTILLSILSKLNGGDGNYESLRSEGDNEISEYLYTRLKGKKYMIVLDNVYDTQMWDCLRRSFPEQNNGSLVLLTTELKEVALLNSFYIYEMADFSEDYIWDALLFGIFGGNSCPPELEEAGKKIAKNCHGLRFVLTKVMIFLFEAEKTPECWNKLATDEENSIFKVDNELLEYFRIQAHIRQEMLQNTVISKFASNIVDLSDLTKEVKLHMFPIRLVPKMEIMSFFGMAGIGKTILVKKIFEDQSILCHFDHHAWITLGPKYQSKEILEDVLVQIYPDIDKMQMKGDEKLAEELLEQLSNKNCLIVLDDVWNIGPIAHIHKKFPNIRGKLLVTTRLERIALLGEIFRLKFQRFDNVHKMCLLNIEESWCLLRQIVFGKGPCPHELEKAGKMISENCEGLPLTIVKVAGHLSKAKMTQDYWIKVAEKKNSVFTEVYNEVSKVLLPSYNNMPQQLKACFLYMGVFLQNYEISTSKLTDLWIVEGFLEPNTSKTTKDFAKECLSELVNLSLVLVRQKGSNFGIKTCRLHSVFWHLCNNEAVKNKFFRALNTYYDVSIEVIKDQRRLCFRNNMLLGIKEVYNSMMFGATARSLLCTSPLHQYPVPIYFGLRLLRVLDALTIRFYEFPIDVVRLTHLRYLALTCSRNLPASISKLWNLEYLIVSQHLSMRSSRDSSYLPIEIWDLKKLIHLHIMGCCLPNPNSSALLPNLLKLLDVNADSCTESILEKAPNLKKLGIRIEFAPDEDGKAFHCLDDISRLHGLESLKCVVLRLELGSRVFNLPVSLLLLPPNLKKLSLSGLGYPWKYMDIIGELPNLEVLKLRCYAFQGPKWETTFCSFIKLKFLLIEDMDLVCWKSRAVNFSQIEYLGIKHCYKLKELPDSFSRYFMIEVVDCNPSVGIWARQMRENEKRLGVKSIEVDINSSWDARNLK